MKKFILVLIIFLSYITVYGQNEHSKITILAGSSVPISFNSYTKMNDGVLYTSWTRFRILYFDTLSTAVLDPASHWQLLVRSNTVNIPGDGGITPLNLDKVELLVSVTNGGGAIITTPYTITSADTQIIGNGANPTGTTIGATIGPNTEVQISYRVGNNAAPPAPNSMLGEAPGYYFLDLIFTLQKQ